jgi:putative ABC transport system substrate-binding protein
MRRRDFAFGLAAALAPSLGYAQQQERRRRIGYLTAATGSPENELGVEQTRAIVEGLREFGWFDGRNVVLDHRFVGTGRERAGATAKDLVASRPDVILAIGSRATTAVLAETKTIPVVFAMVSDPVGSGLAASLARPGGNATGIGIDEAPIVAKRLELLQEIAPRTRRVLLLVQADSRSQQVFADAAVVAAQTLGLSLTTEAVADIGDYERSIPGFAAEPDGAVVALSGPALAVYQAKVNQLVAQYHLPTMYSYAIDVERGGLISYGPDRITVFRQTGRYIDRILRGAPPADLPIELPTRFVLAVNLQSAKALGLTVPQSLRARADKVIE